MVDKDELKRMYESGMSTPQIAMHFSIPVSRARKVLIDGEVKFRTTAEGIRLCIAQGKRPSRKGIKRGPFPQSWRDNLREARLKYCDQNAKGVSLKPNGYLEITRGENKSRSLHRVLMEKHLGRKLDRHEVVHHIDGDRRNNAIDNLQVMTWSEHSKLHAKERIEGGRNYDISKHNARGQNNPHAKLTDFMALEIYRSDMTIKELMNKYKVSKSVINKIKRGDAWSHVTKKQTA